MPLYHPRSVSRRALLRSLVGLAAVHPGLRAVAQPTAADADGPYQSPYSVRYSFTRHELMGDIDEGLRGERDRESSFRHDDWYSERVRTRYGTWGPPSRHYLAPEGLARRSLAWKQQRVIATALRFEGYAYQHHHIPDWDPPSDWPWSPCCAGRNGKGVDCSNFTAFAYNLGLGLRPSGGIERQAEQLEIKGPGPDRLTRAERIALPATYADYRSTLRTGDLLYIRNLKGILAHVVLWIGDIGVSPDGTPLVLDSHGGKVRDSNGVRIPCGIHLRPFRDQSWYHRSASHAHRLLFEE